MNRGLPVLEVARGLERRIAASGDENAAKETTSLSSVSRPLVDLTF